jgi:hypothetical protein
VRIIERADAFRARLPSACFARFLAEAEFANVVNHLEKNERVACLLIDDLSIAFRFMALIFVHLIV